MKINFLIGLLFVIIFSGYAQSQVQEIPTPEPGPAPIGGDRDDHGCLVGAGYSWCEAKQKCLRAWEEPCEEKKKETDYGKDCKSDGDCVPYPCACHPHECFNSEAAIAMNCARPEACTELFDCGAAYDPEDCLCQNGKCVNGNEGKKCN